MTNRTTMKWIAALSVPACISGAWLTARVVSGLGALVFVGQMVVGKLVLMGLASALGVAFADAQGMSGWIYARDRYGIDRQVYAEMYQNLNNFGNDMYILGRGYDGGVRAVLYDGRTQAFISYAFTADAQNPGRDLVKATLNARAYNPNQPAITQVFAAGFGGTMIGFVSGSMFAQAYANTGGSAIRILQN